MQLTERARQNQYHRWVRRLMRRLRLWDSGHWVVDGGPMVFVPYE
jgi:hypothetical protein